MAKILARTMKALVAGFPALAYMYTVGSVGFWLPLYLSDKGYTFYNLQLIATFYFMSLALGGIAAGMISDKIKRPDLVAFTGMILNGIVVIAMYYFYNFNHMVLLRLLQGLALSTAIPVALGSLSLIFGESMGVGLTSLFMALGMSVGSLTAGLLITSFGYFSMFLIAGILSIIAAFLSLRIETPHTTSASPKILSNLKKLPFPVIVVIFGVFLRQFFATGVYSILSVIFNKLLGLTIIATSIVLAVNPAVQGSISLPLARKVERYATILYPSGIFITSIVFFLLHYASTLTIAIISMIVQGIAFGTVNISGNYIIISNTEKEIRYTASSLFNLFFNLGWIIGTFTAGIYMRTHSPIGWLDIASIGVILTSIIVFVFLHYRKRL